MSRRGEGLAGLVVLCDGNIEKRLSSLAAVGQRKEFVRYVEVLFDLPSEGCASFSELQRDDLPIRLDLWFAYPSMLLKQLNGLDGRAVRNAERHSKFTHLALRMPGKVEQHTGLDRRDAKRL